MRVSIPYATIALTIAFAHSASALIMVGGKDPVSDHNWPAGSLEAANHKSRQSYYEGPPFGGGEYVFQHRGDTNVFNDFFAKFTQIKAPDLLVVVHEGPNENTFASPEDKAKKLDRVDWMLTLWTPENFYRLFGNASSTIAYTQPEYRAEMPSPRLDVFVAERGVDWSKVQIPTGVRVVDERAISHGYKSADGSVIVGTAYDMLTSKPIAAVEIVLTNYQNAPAKPAPPLGGESDGKIELKTGDEMHWVDVLTAVGDADGRFELKNIPPGNYNVELRCVGYATRVVGTFYCRGGAYQSFTARLSQAVEQSGKVLDSGGKPLAKVQVRVDSTISVDGRGYPTAGVNDNQKVVTDAEGHFTLTGLPRGQTQITLWADNLYQVNMLQSHAIPSEGLTLRMTGTGTIKGKAMTTNGKPAENVSVWPEGGNKVGSWGGGMNVNPDGTFQFDNVPPGKYYISANPAAQFAKEPKGTPVEVKAGETAEVDLVK